MSQAQADSAGRAANGGDAPVTDAIAPRPPLAHTDTWHWFAGIARVGVLVVAIAGTFNLEGISGALLLPLAAYYVLGFASSIAYLYTLGRGYRVSFALTWAQVLIDFGVVAATVSFTGGPTSVLTFLFVVVILEAALLLGLMNGFVFAGLATAFMLVQALLAPYTAPEEPLIRLAYNFVVQGLAYFLTAAISGFWNQRLRLLQHFQTEILDNMNSGFVVTDAEGAVVAHNRAAERILGLERGEGVGLPVHEVFRVASGEESPIATAIRAGRDFTSYEFQVLTRAGEEKLLGLTTNRMHDMHGRLTGVIASFTDLTEAARMREELKRQDRMAVIGELAASLAHEIRNPVAAIRMATEELSRNVHEPQSAGRLANIAMRESDHLNYIVSGFLDFARNPKIKRERVDLCRVCKTTAESLRSKHEKAGDTELAIIVDAKLTPCCVYGDADQLRQLITNIASNGIDAMDARGRLTMTLSAEGNAMEVRISDEGPGIEPDKVARIFEPFYTSKSGGVGMGLAICQRIVNQHDGTIRVTSREGGGTTMTIRLPAAAE